MKQVRTPHVADTDTARWKLKLLEDTCLPHISGCDDIVASENSHTYIELWNTQKGLQHGTQFMELTPNAFQRQLALVTGETQSNVYKFREGTHGEVMEN
ncbi:uncharacterized protein LOC144820423 isoform X4 [Lissotriton helveticus]